MMPWSTRAAKLPYPPDSNRYRAWIENLRELKEGWPGGASAPWCINKIWDDLGGCPTQRAIKHLVYFWMETGADQTDSIPASWRYPGDHWDQIDRGQGWGDQMYGGSGKHVGCIMVYHGSPDRWQRAVMTFPWSNQVYYLFLKRWGHAMLDSDWGYLEAALTDWAQHPDQLLQFCPCNNCRLDKGYTPGWCLPDPIPDPMPLGWTYNRPAEQDHFYHRLATEDARKRYRSAGNPV